LYISYFGGTWSYPGGADGWYNLIKVTAVNLGVDYCDPAANSCSSMTQSWPTVTYTYGGSGSNTTETVTDSAGRATRYTRTGTYFYQNLGPIIGIKRPGASSDNVTINSYYG